MESVPDPLSELILPEPPPMIVSEVEIKTAGEEEVVETSTVSFLEGKTEDEITQLTSPVGESNLSEDIQDKQEGDNYTVIKTEFENVEHEPPVSSKYQEKFSADDDYDEEDTFQVPCIVPLPQPPPPPQATEIASASSSSLGSISPSKSGTSRPAITPTTSAPKPLLMERYPPKSRKELDEEDEREKMQLLVSNFSDGQYDRYEMFRRSTFPKAAIKRLMQTITGNAVSQNVVIAMSGIAKVFVGEVVEEALDAMERVGETGPLRPKQLREAVRRLRARGNRCAVPRSNTRRYNPFPL